MNGLGHKLPQGLDLTTQESLFGPTLLTKRGLISYVPVGALVATLALHRSHRTVIIQVYSRLAQWQGPSRELGKDSSELEKITSLFPMGL